MSVTTSVPSASEIVSVRLDKVKVTFPTFLTVMLYSTSSPVPLYPSGTPLGLSVMFATTFTTVSAGAASIVVTVGSFVGSESVSASVSKVESPSSLLSSI